MQIIVIGCGNVGSRFAQVMAEEGHDVVIIDDDPNHFSSLRSNFNGITVTGVPIDEDVLKNAGILTADAFVAVTPDDNINIMACQIAKEIFKVPIALARIFNPKREHVFHEFGIKTICPTNMTVEDIRTIIMGQEPESTYFIGNTDVSFIYEKVAKENIGKKISSFKVSENRTVFGIIRKGKLHFVGDNTRLEQDDTIIFARKA